MKRHHIWTQRMPFILLLLFVVFTIWLTSRWNALPLIWASLIGLNIVTACAFSYDKLVAGKDLTRVPERVLLTLCFIGGTIGGGGMMLLLRHKTAKTRFRRAIMAIAVVQLLGGIGLVVFRGPLS